MVAVFMSVDCTKESSNSVEDKTVYYKTDSIKELAARLARREYNFVFRQLSGGFQIVVYEDSGLKKRVCDVIETPMSIGSKDDLLEFANVEEIGVISDGAKAKIRILGDDIHGYLTVDEAEELVVREYNRWVYNHGCL